MLFFVFFTCVAFSCVVSESAVALRDGSLAMLADLFNSNSELFKSWSGKRDDLERLLELISPWMVSDVAESLKIVKRPYILDGSSVNCSEVRYGTVLTGKPRLQPAPIIDFIPFGYDVEKLEVRLYELFDVVDIFVIYEAPATQVGYKKPMFFKLLENMSC